MIIVHYYISTVAVPTSTATDFFDDKRLPFNPVSLPTFATPASAAEDPAKKACDHLFYTKIMTIIMDHSLRHTFDYPICLTMRPDVMSSFVFDRQNEKNTHISSGLHTIRVLI